MRTSKKIIATFCAFAIVFSALIPITAYATEVSSEGNFWQSLAESSPLLRSVIGKVYSGVCSDSPDGKHHANINASAPMQKDNSFGGVYCTCEYCGQRFGVSYSDLEAAYDSYVVDMPTNGVDSTGGLLWYPTAADIVDNETSCASFGIGWTSSPAYNVSIDCIPYSDANLTFTKTVNGVFAEATHDSAHYLYRNYWTNSGLSIKLIVPVNATYYYTNSGNCTRTYYNSNDIVGIHNLQYSNSYIGGLSAGDYLTVSAPTNDDYGAGFRFTKVSISLVLPVFRVVGVSPSADVYNINTRAGTVSGDLAVMGDNNTLTKINTTIINETNNTYYNPATDTTTEITDWTYNYTDRSYTLNLDGGGTAEVVYGNDNVTIIEGGNTYTYYYYINTPADDDPGTGGSGGSGGAASGTDLWDSAGETIGSLLTIPLRIIKAVFVKVLAWLTDLAATIGDGVADLVDTILGWFDSLPELFSGFLGFLSAIFPFIPEEAMTFITIGLAAVVIIGIIRALRRR